MLNVQETRAKARRLQAMGNEMLALARELERSADEAAGSISDDPAERNLFDPAKGDSPQLGEIARRAYRDRRRREEIFDAGNLFGEPAWDMLLDLFIAAKEERPISVMSACIGSAVPPTTALRWLTALEQQGLVSRENDPTDARRTFVRLNPDAYAKMVRYFAEGAEENSEAASRRGGRSNAAAAR